MTDCLFCRIASGEIPSRPVFSDDRVYAFHDVAPAANSTTRQPPSDDLGQRGQIGCDAGQLLDASGRPAEA